MTTYEALLKDRTIIAAEVLHEYDEKVRICFPLVKDDTLTSLLSLVCFPTLAPSEKGRMCDD